MEHITTCGQATTTPEIAVTFAPVNTHVLTFLMFAEYMGYVSEFIEDVDSWANGKTPAIHIQAFLMVEARDILAQMSKDYTTADLRQWWNDFYPLVLYKGDEALSKCTKKATAIVM